MKTIRDVGQNFELEKNKGKAGKTTGKKKKMFPENLKAYPQRSVQNGLKTRSQEVGG